MKRRCRSPCCYSCCWLTLLLVASSVIYASPDSSTTATVKFNSHQQQQQQQQLQQQQRPTAPTIHSATIHNSIISNNNNKNNNHIMMTTTMTMATMSTTTKRPTTTEAVTTAASNLVAADMMTIMMELSGAATIPHTSNTMTMATAAAATTTITKVTAATTTKTENITSSSSKSSRLSKSNALWQQQQHQLQQQLPQKLQQQQQQQLVHKSMFFDVRYASHGQRHRRQLDAGEKEQNEKCRLFIEGNPNKNEFHSPDYPNNYTRLINCTRVIKAPKGQIIRLDFRNSFHIEAKEECKFDFLEIRDGQYGFSNLIGKYCGTDFPPEITSTERYLWLFFHSDESIEYSGFTAVYEFIDRNREAPSTDLNCTIDKSDSHGFINSTDVPSAIKETVMQNKIPLDCMWRIQVEENWRILLKFLDFKLIKPNDCEQNFLDIFPEETTMPSRMKNFCGSAGEGITSDTNIMHIRFYAEEAAINSTFGILYTAYRDKGQGCDAETEFDCEDATCISSKLKCDGNTNCKFRWDEESADCKKNVKEQSEHVIIIIIVFGLILGGMVATFLVNCIRKIMHDQKIIREHIRQSKESKLNELGRNSKARSRDNLSIAMSPRQKHSQTSLQILDDVSNRYYREVVPIAVQSGKGELKEKEHSILRHHHDMIVQTSLQCDDSSTTTTTDPPAPPGGGAGGNVCDMGCQTRESLFGSTLTRQKSIASSIGGAAGSVPPPPRFSTFGYDMQQPPPPPPPAVSTLTRHSAVRVPIGSIELEERHSRTTAAPQHQQQHTHHVRPAEICHHHHQHQQHLQQQQLQQQQQKYHHQAHPHQQQQQYAVQPTQPQQHHQQQSHHQQQHAQKQQQQQQQQHHQSTATIPALTTFPPAATTNVLPATTPAPPGGKNKHQKVDESKVFIDIRNSAPDVIIMTSH